MRADTIAYPVLAALPGCIAAELLRSEIPAISFLSLAPGEAPSLDMRESASTADGCGSIGWVRLDSFFPSINFPEPDSLPSSSWRAFGFTVEIGVMRCASLLDEDGEAPTAADYLGDTLLQLADMAAIRRAICVCLKGLGREFVLGTYGPVGPQGGIVGGIWTVTVRGS